MILLQNNTLLPAVEQTRRIVSRATEAKHKSRLGQFFTPATTARFMAGLFTRSSDETCRLLDAGAGIGCLSAAFLDRWASGGFAFDSLRLDAFEIDDALHPHLYGSIKDSPSSLDLELKVCGQDFVEAAVDSLLGNPFRERHPGYTHTILNPPYKKIRNDSSHRSALRRVGIKTVNLYSAFTALAICLLEARGQLVAIIPRSFCNGPYYLPFRRLMLEKTAIRHIHLFASRKKAFKDDEVLQENIIIMLERGVRQGNVKISTSMDDGFEDLETRLHSFDHIVSSSDQQRFIHIPTDSSAGRIQTVQAIRCTLKDIGVEVATGPIVDFRLKAHLCDMPEPGTAPLIYPGHFTGSGIDWPKPGFKKPNAIRRCAETEKWLYPSGFYCVVRRFSSKEEKRRVVARVVDPAAFPGAERIGFENHLNVFHAGRQGLPQALAHGLAAFLNSTAVDENFRCFNGHTQVNATDLRMIKYPDRKALMKLGQRTMDGGEPGRKQHNSSLRLLRVEEINGRQPAQEALYRR